MEFAYVDCKKMDSMVENTQHNYHVIKICKDYDIMISVAYVSKEAELKHLFIVHYLCMDCFMF